MDWIIALVTLTAMEIVLGIDNIVFISILCGKLPVAQRAKARTIGLGLAMGTRILLLLSLNWVLSLTNPIIQLTDLGVPASWVLPEGVPIDPPPGAEPSHSHGHGPEEVNNISIRDLILLFGGLFLIGNSVLEIHHKLEGEEGSHDAPSQVSFTSVLIQIAILDIIFSLDSVITAVGMAKHIWVMVTAVVLSVIVMMMFAGAVERFVTKYPTIKMLALSFLILIGVLLVAEGIGSPVNKGYIYFAMAFSLAVELLNMRLRKPPAKAVAAE
ncbi:TerC family protein [Planctomicrobium piriforme]|uniref:Membrane protein TerC, possibly involved in tellurium resistance n=1 Tax=Planctomicrobium piriforme TaxID=1576369 RepID=A0A1I3E856_9PLAN|nr:TerC family protein [Planctomicrobium piriforme]SFH95136.1 Membrane protein TerC, possibly involved in tellurium resistance [Planctomicrobium piriforme]